MVDVFSRLGSFTIGWRKGFFLSFALGFVVRLIPEVLSFPHPIGFDTVYYAARMKSGVVWPHWSSLFSTWLIYAVLVSAYQAVRVNPFLFLKLVAPTLYALNVCGVYFFAWKALGWETRKALSAAFFFAFQLASLGLSWQFHRNMLGLAMLLFTLPLLSMKRNYVFLWFSSLSTLVVFGHELASVVLFAVVFRVMIGDFLKGERVRMLKVLVATLPALVIFLTSVYLRLFPFSFHVETNVLDVPDVAHPSPGGLFFLTNYLGVKSSIQHYPTYLTLASHVFSLFGVFYLLCLPLISVGFFRDRMLDSWASLLLVGSFSALIIPICALDPWHRWMFMLVYPFTFYAVNGIGKVLGSLDGVVPDVSWLKWMKVSKRIAFGLLLCMSLLGTLFMTVRFGDGGGIFYIRPTTSYLPTTMLHNSVPLQDTKATVEVMEWLNRRMDDGSCVLLFDAFLCWADLHLNKKNVVVHYEMDAEEALDLAIEHSFDPIYLVWWNQNIGWYGDLSVPERFDSIFDVDRISVFKYSPGK